MNKTTSNEPIWADDQNNNVRRTRTNRWDPTNPHAVKLADDLLTKLHERFCCEHHDMDVAIDNRVRTWGFLDNGYEGIMIHAWGDNERGNFNFTLIRTTKAAYGDWVTATREMDEILWLFPGISR